MVVGVQQALCHAQRIVLINIASMLSSHVSTSLKTTNWTNEYLADLCHRSSCAARLVEAVVTARTRGENSIRGAVGRADIGRNKLLLTGKQTDATWHNRRTRFR